MHFSTQRKQFCLFFGFTLLQLPFTLHAQLVTPNSAQAATRFSFADLQRLQSVGDVQMSPDGDAIAYSVYSVDTRHDRGDQNLWVVQLSGARVVPVALPRMSEPSWSPDGQMLAVVSNSTGKSTVLRKDTLLTGSSAGGELTAWITGKTSRFRAAVAEKPVINQISQFLATDQYLRSPLVYKGDPWTREKELWAHSSLSLVGSVTTPTLFIVGEQDFRTSMEETLQMYDALQLRGIPTALLRAPGAGHEDLGTRPSQNTAIVAVALFVRPYMKIHSRSRYSAICEGHGR